LGSNPPPKADWVRLRRRAEVGTAFSMTGRAGTRA
jgi:hypothetical protein